jgi:hypothetical protein
MMMSVIVNNIIFYKLQCLKKQILKDYKSSVLVKKIQKSIKQFIFKQINFMH